MAETRHVFLDGNALTDRYFSGFQIAELGFGTGLNCVTALQLWRSLGISGPLKFTSFEAFPLTPDQMRTALAGFSEIAEDTALLLDAFDPASLSVRTDALHLDVITGDARETLPCWEGAADAWFLDGFSPARNPELWEDALLAEVAGHTRPGGTAATYSAAGHIRRGLEKAGFQVERRPGYGRKRHMTVAILK